jgi:O-antigen/teichoic acid export membrane protein
MKPVPSARRLIVAAMARQFAGMLATIVTVPIIAHKLGADALGAWVLVISGAMVVQLSDLGLSTAVRRAIVAGDDERALRSLSRALKSALVVGFAGVFFARFLIGDVEGVGGASAALWILPIAAWLLAIALPLHSYVLSYGGVVGLAWTRGASCVVQVALTLAALHWFPGLVAPALGVLAGALIEIVLLVWLALRHKPATRRATLKLVASDWRSDLRDGSAALMINAAVYATVRIDALVLARISPLAVVASYCVAGRIVDQSYVLAKQVSSGLLPLFRHEEERYRALQLGTTVLTGLVTPGMIALALLGGPLLVLWAGSAGATDIAMIAVALLGFAAILAAFGEVACSLLTHTAGSAWAGAVPVSLGAAVNVVLTLILAPIAGFWGAACATILGAATTMSYVWIRVARSGLPDRRMLRRLTFRLAQSASTSGVLACLCLTLPKTTSWALLGCTIVTLAGFLVAIRSSLPSWKQLRISPLRWRAKPTTS